MYSATLFVALPRKPKISADSTPVSVSSSAKTPNPAGPGLPRAPPSIQAREEDALAAVALDDRALGADLDDDLRPDAIVASPARPRFHDPGAAELANRRQGRAAIALEEPGETREKRRWNPGPQIGDRAAHLVDAGLHRGLLGFPLAELGGVALVELAKGLARLGELLLRFFGAN